MRLSILATCLVFFVGCTIESADPDSDAGQGTGGTGGLEAGTGGTGGVEAGTGGAEASTGGTGGTEAGSGGTGGSEAGIEAALTIVTLGDSLTEGVGDSEWSSDGTPVGYPGRLELRLTARGADSTVENIGRSGWTSTDLVSGVDWGDGPEPSQLSLAIPVLQTAVSEGRTAVATLWIGSNDLFGLYDWCHEPDNAQCEEENLAEYTANVDEALGQLSATGATVFVALLDDQSKRPVLVDPQFADSFPNIGPAERVLMSNQTAKYNDVVTNLAAKYGATTVDFYHTTTFEQPATLDDDGNHPNADGYEEITTVWETAVVAGLAL